MKKTIYSISLIAIAMLFLQQEGFTQSQQSGSTPKKDFYKAKKAAQKQETLQTINPAPKSFDNTHYVDSKTGEILPISKQKGRKENIKTGLDAPKPKE
jgi:hypothetical protein